MFVQDGCCIYSLIYFDYVSAFIPFALLSCLDAMKLRDADNSIHISVMCLPSLHTQTHTHFTYLFPSWSQGSVGIYKTHEIKTRGFGKIKRLVKILCMYGSWIFLDWTEKRILILISLLVFFFFPILNFQNFQIIAFILCRRTKTSWSIRIVIVGNVSTNQLVKKVSRPPALFLPIVTKDAAPGLIFQNDDFCTFFI